MSLVNAYNLILQINLLRYTVFLLQLTKSSGIYKYNEL